MIAASNNAPGLTIDQYNHLLTLLNRTTLESGESMKHESFAANAFLVSTGTCLLSAGINLNWNINNGATDHITPDL